MSDPIPDRTLGGNNDEAYRTASIEEPKVEEPELPPDPPKTEVKFNDARSAAMMIEVGGSGVMLKDFSQLVDFSKWMAASGAAVPKHLRGNVGGCIFVCDVAIRLGFSPWQVARQTYTVNDMMAFQAQIVTAMINKHAPIKGRLKYEFSGEGQDRQCRVTATPKTETEPLEYVSPKIRDIQPKNSPLWVTDPDQQLAYLSGSRFCRRHFSDVIMGIYSPDEIEDAGIQTHVGADRARDVTPHPLAKLREQLATSVQSNEGFTNAVVDNALAELEMNQEVVEEPKKTEDKD